MTQTRIAAASVAIAALIILGCTGLDPLEPEEQEPPPVCTVDASLLSGVWRISGSGSRSECLDESLDTDYFELNSAPLKLTATADAFGNVQFTLGQSIRGFMLEGAVDCDAVNFTSQEDFRGDVLTYEWDGDLFGENTFKGTFKGTGPEGCKSEGEFRMVKNP